MDPNKNSPDCYQLKKKRKIFTSGERNMILSVYKHFRANSIDDGISLPRVLTPVLILTWVCSHSIVTQINYCGTSSGGHHDSVLSKYSSLHHPLESRLRIVRELDGVSVGSSIESTTSEEEEEEHPLNLTNINPELLTNFWNVQKLIKYVKGGNQNATIAAISGLHKFDFMEKVLLKGVHEVGGLEVFVNLLETNDDRCKEGALEVLRNISRNPASHRELINLGCVSILVNMLCTEAVTSQIIAADILANLTQMPKAGRIVRKFHGIGRMVALLSVKESIRNSPKSRLKTEEKLLVECARAAARALWSLSASTKNIHVMVAEGCVPLFAEWIRTRHRDVIVFAMGTIQHGLDVIEFREDILLEDLFDHFIRHLRNKDVEVEKFTVSILFKCAETEIGRQSIREHGGLDEIAALAKHTEYISLQPRLMGAVIGAVWKCSISLENAIRFNELDLVPILINCLDSDDEEVLTHAAGALAEMARLPEVRTAIRDLNGLPGLVELLRRVRPSELHANAAKALGECARDVRSMDIIDELDAVRLIWTLLKYDNKDLQCAALMSLCPCIENARDTGEMVRSLLGGLEIIVNLLHSTDLEVLTCVCNVITKIAQDRENLAVLTDHGIVPILAKLLISKSEHLREPLMECIGTACRWEKNAYDFGQLGVIKYLIRYLCSSHNPNIRHNAAFALYELSKDPINCLYIHREGAVPYLVTCVGSTDDLLQETASGILKNIRTLAFTLHEFRKERKLKRRRR